MLTCYTCGDDKQHSNFWPSEEILEDCDLDLHCFHCLQEWISTQLRSGKINDGKIENLVCMDGKHRLDREFVQVLASDEDKERFERELAISVFAGDPSFRRCHFADCQSAQLHGGGSDRPIFKCQSCHRKSCVACDSPWHEDETCGIYKSRTSRDHTADNQASRDQVKKTTKPCPCCGINIAKVGGCDHMTCTHCTHEFCWQCKADYTSIRSEGNTAHQRDCPYHSANLPNLIVDTKGQASPDVDSDPEPGINRESPDTEAEDETGTEVDSSDESNEWDIVQETEDEEDESIMSD